MEAEKRKPNVVMFPFMAQGHIIPFLALALHIEKTKNFNITFINTPLNIIKLRSSLPQHSSNIKLVEIPFDSTDHGLPPYTENTDLVHYDLVVKLLEASTTLKPAFRKIISDLVESQNGDPRICIVADIFFGWTASIAKELGLLHVIFSGAGGFGMACYYSIWMNLPHKKVESDDFLLPDFPEALTFHKSQLPLSIIEAAADRTDAWSNFQDKNLPEWANSNGILFNTIHEFDQIGLTYFKRKLGLSVWPIGPILLSTEDRTQNSTTAKSYCKEWLDTKPKNSVLYISFGSNNTISLSHMKELALALDKSGKFFIWVVRPPLGFDINSEFNFEKWFPEGFNESKKGLLVQKWAPQVEILSHNSVSAFLSHCGWNSVLEALSYGVPLLGWPMAAEQFFNVKFLEEDVGVCVEVARGKGCELKHEDIVKKIELVMMGESEKGKEIRRKALKSKEMIENAMEIGGRGSSVEAFDDFFQSCFGVV